MPDLTDLKQSASAVYRGTIRHRRFTPIKHAFTYKLTVPLLDLDFADRELEKWPLVGSGRRAAAALLRSDFAGYHAEFHDNLLSGKVASDLKNFIVEQVKSRIGVDVTGKVLLLSHLRYWGFMMNPIAVFYCYSLQGGLAAVVLQVTNTPWREKVLYVLPANLKRRTLCCEFSKDMHVSPFHPMNMHYLCRLQPPGDRLFFHLENHSKGSGDSACTCHSDATMLFERRTMTSSGLVKLGLAQPYMTLKVGAGIYWQALRLWLKRAPIYDHPGSIDATRTAEKGKPASEHKAASPH